jgi:hypothetical protein
MRTSVLKKKLRLNSETLCLLDKPDLERVAGGATNGTQCGTNGTLCNYSVCLTSCNTCNTRNTCTTRYC